MCRLLPDSIVGRMKRTLSHVPACQAVRWVRLASLDDHVIFVFLQEGDALVHVVLGGPEPDVDTVAATLCLALHLGQVALSCLFMFWSFLCVHKMQICACM